MRPILLLLALLPLAAVEVTVARCPEGGVQPQAVVTATGARLVALHGDPKAASIRLHRAEGGAGLAVGTPGSAIAMGSVRGVHLAAGRDGRLHLAWMGSQGATPRAPGGQSPLLYTTIDPDGSVHESRNLIERTVGLDGGGSITADGTGRVWVFWHGGEEGGATARKVVYRLSSDDGASFAAERALTGRATGSCPCCGMRAGIDTAGTPLVLFRAATAEDQRGTYLLALGTDGSSGGEIAPWQIASCPMSTAAIATGAPGAWLAWQTRDQLFFGSWDGQRLVHSLPLPSRGKARKHPALAVATDGSVCVAWTEGTAWAKGGSLCWQVFDGQGTALPEARGRRDDLPAWSLPTVVARGPGSFAIWY